MILPDQIIARPNPQGEDTSTQDALEILQRNFSPNQPPEGFVVGRTQMRNALADQAGCSLMRAEELIKQLLEDGQVQFVEGPLELETGPPYWEIQR